jgi:hypothetical protein
MLVVVMTRESPHLMVVVVNAPVLPAVGLPHCCPSNVRANKEPHWETLLAPRGRSIILCRKSK